MIRRTLLAIMLIAVASTVSAANDDCEWYIVQSTTVTVCDVNGCESWTHVYWGYSCNITVTPPGGSGDGGGGDPPPQPPPPDPYLRIRSISDGDPTAPVLNIESSGVSSIDLISTVPSATRMTARRPSSSSRRSTPSPV
jgi:hypothetical protein